MSTYISVAYLRSRYLNMTKYYSRLILKIFSFTINASELVLRNKKRFVVWIYVEYKFDNSPPGYCIE